MWQQQRTRCYRLATLRSKTHPDLKKNADGSLTIYMQNDIFALFGASIAHVDHPQRALLVRSGGSSVRHQLSLLNAVGDALGGQAGATVEFQIPGINMNVLSALLLAGFKIDHVGQFMASRTFGRFDRYVPSGGTLL